eukprot:Tbor_TRINITY_DN1805_c0_g1::TRINITY_DN1805_c0_g1_i1::g.23050::m.23050
MSSSSSVDQLMKKAVTTASDFYSNKQHHVVSAAAASKTGKKPDPSAMRGTSMSYEQRRLMHAQERKQKKETLSQWYGMKRVIKTPEVERELELLKYRNFLTKDRAHRVPSTDSGSNGEFLEFGYFAGTGKKKRRQYKSFADEWIDESDELKDIVKRRMNINVKRHKKDKGRKEKIVKKSEMVTAKKRLGGEKRRRNKE